MSRAEPRATSPRPTGTAAATAILLLVGGCVQQGDFGRVAPSAWNGLLDTTGGLAAQYREEAVSGFPLTDDERELRQRAWRFLTPATAYPLFTRMLAELTTLRVLPASWRWSDPESYHAGLLAPDFRSPASRYRRLSEDAVADARLIPAFARIAARVGEADLTRLKGLPFIRQLSDDDIQDAAARVAENRCLIAWVRHEATARVAAYRFALEHLLIEAPQREAVEAERAVVSLAARLPALAGLSPLEARAPCGLPASLEIARDRRVISKG